MYIFIPFSLNLLSFLKSTKTQNTHIMNKSTLLTVMATVMLIFCLNAESWGQVNITPTRTDVSGFPAWTDTDIAGTTYLQLLKSTSSTISPAMNFNNYTSETLNFKARTFGGVNATENEVTVWISTNNGGSWTSLGTRTPTTTTLTAVTPFDLSTYNGTQVKIKFTTAGTNNTIGAGIDDLAITGISSASPSLTVSITSLSGFIYVTGNGPSTEQNFTVSGSDLSSTLDLAAPTNYEISQTSGGTFGSSISLTPNLGTVPTTTIFVRLKAGLSIGNYDNEIINITSTGATPKTVTCSGSVIAPPPQIDWANLQWPPSGSISLGDGYNVYAQVYEPGVTDAGGQGAGITCWIGYSTSNTDPSTWTNWVVATYNSDAGNNDEYIANIGAAITSTGTYYYASKFQLGIATPVYGGFSGGFWNGTSNASGVLTVNAGAQINWANLQWPQSGSISNGGTYNVYAQVYEPGVTDGVGQGTGITCWIGYNSSNTDPSTWTNWVPATFNTDVGSNDEYFANIGSVITTPGTYYYASRFKLGLADYVYGGFNGGFWDGTNNVSGTLTVNIPNILINEVDSDTPGTDAAEFIELYDGGVGNSNLTGLVIVLYNGNNDLSYAAYDLDGYSTNAGGYFVLGNTGVPGVDLIFSGNFLQNGQDAVALYIGDATSFPNNTPLTTSNIMDAIVYDTDDPDDPTLLTLLNSGQPQVNESGRSKGDTHSCQRIPNGSGGARNTSTYDQTYPTPDAANAIQQVTWNGSTSTDWAIATNWTPNIVPDYGVIANIVDVANDPVISATAISRDVNIAASAIVEINPLGRLTVSGTLTNSAGANGLIVNSDATGTGSLIHSNSGVDATIERYVTAANWTLAADGWHLLSSPVANQSISGSWTPTGTGNDYDFYVLDETKTTEYWLNQKVSANNLTTFVPGIGYLVAYQQTDTKTFTGTLNSSDVTLNGLTNTSGSAYPGWHLAGNPFASAIDYDLGNWTKTNIDAEMQVWNSTAASYKTSTEVGGVIPAMNGFMVHTSGSGVLTIPKDARVHNSSNWYKSDGSEFILLKANDLDMQTSQSSIVRFNSQATADYDQDFDSYYIQGFAPLFYSNYGGEKYALNTLPELTDNLIIPFDFIKNPSVNFNIELAQNIPDAVIYLTDHKTNTVTNLNETPLYSFTSQEGDVAGRFSLHFKNANSIADPTSEGGFIAYSTSGQIHVISDMTGTVVVTDVAGRQIATSLVSQGNTFNINLQNHPGIYLVKLVTLKGNSTRKVFVR
jgi:hypothetical protein